ncbi:MAG: hypothetical protein M1839_008159 [Geoglossum umbratile]|nr:MAG: hypothetical protein M1839_008159 [Geoglossum umbratile]
MPQGMRSLEDLSYVKIPGSYPLDASTPSAPSRPKSHPRDASTPSTPNRPKLRPKSRRKPDSSPPRHAPARTNSTREVPLVDTPETGSPEPAYSQDGHSPLDTPGPTDYNTTSANTTPSPPRHRRVVPGEESSSPLAARCPEVCDTSVAYPDLTKALGLISNTQAAESLVHVERNPPAESITQQYEPYPANAAVWDLLFRSLTKKDQLPGRIYAFRTRKFPELLKVGYTTRTTKERLDELKRCGYQPIEVYSSGGEKLPHARRVESLIQAELAQYRKRLPPCGYGSRARHGEWFKVELADLKEAINRYSSWIRKRPYRETAPGEWHLRKESALSWLAQFPKDYIPRAPSGRTPEKRSGPPHEPVTAARRTGTIPDYFLPLAAAKSDIGAESQQSGSAAMHDLQDRISRLLSKILAVNLVISLVLHFYPPQESFAVRLILMFLWFTLCKIT